MFQNYFQTIKFLESLDNLPNQITDDYQKSRRLNLKRFRYFLKLIGNPHRDFKYVHVGGTSGKGSTVSMIQSVLTAAGYKTGAYFSPHPTTTIERIRINNHYISTKNFSAIIAGLSEPIKKVYLKTSYGRPSYFEILLAAAFLYFKKEKCDYVILEVGCGGEFDPTNIIQKPKFTIITNVNHDHTHILGKVLKKIAETKAGIIKPNSIFLTTETRPAILNIFRSVCRQKKAKFNQIKSATKLIKNDFDKAEFEFENEIYQLAMGGRHQLKNALLAINLANKLGIKKSIIKKGLLAGRLPGRAEKIQSKPDVIIDIAHNDSKIKSLVNILKDLTEQRLFLIIGITESKDSSRMLKKIIPLADQVLLTRYQVSRRPAADLKKLARQVKKISKNKLVPKFFLNPFAALDYALGQAGKNDLIVITGSTYLAGELRQRWIPEEKIVKSRKSF
ncbi:MAG TPA: Mur ligase family protein [Patescibacteria group bacterium]